jgi:hypothetical protein
MRIDIFDRYGLVWAHTAVSHLLGVYARRLKASSKSALLALLKAWRGQAKPKLIEEIAWMGVCPRDARIENVKRIDGCR